MSEPRFLEAEKSVKLKTNIAAAKDANAAAKKLKKAEAEIEALKAQLAEKDRAILSERGGVAPEVAYSALGRACVWRGGGGVWGLDRRAWSRVAVVALRCRPGGAACSAGLALAGVGHTDR